MRVSECLTVIPGKRVLRLDSEQSRNMIRAAEQPPGKRRAFIEKQLSQLKIKTNPYLKSFKLQISEAMLKVCFCAPAWMHMTEESSAGFMD
jgi:hypothetical protein